MPPIKSSFGFRIASIGLVLLVFSVIASSANVIESVFEFNGVDGYFPTGSLIWDSSGTLFGTTLSGGTNDNDKCGTVYSLSSLTDGPPIENVLYSFTCGTDGDAPQSVISDPLGNLYGTAEYAGAGESCAGGCGVVYELTPSGNGSYMFQVIYSFTGASDGGYPSGELIRDADGNLYGAANIGGQITSDCFRGCGTVFEISPSGNTQWTEKTLYSFEGPPDGSAPLGPLIFDSAGNLFGTTSGGGQYPESGTVFELTHGMGDTWSENVLHSFNEVGGDGAFPNGGVILDSNENLFGVTPAGGTDGCGCGILYELTDTGNGQWTESVLHQFHQVNGDPSGNVIWGPDERLYGTTRGTNAPGTVFESHQNAEGQWITSSYLLSKGYSPNCTPIFDSRGRLYATASYSSDRGGGDGLVFRLSIQH